VTASGWFSLISAVITILSWLIREAERRKAFKEGESAAVKRGLEEILETTKLGQEITAKLKAMSDEEIDRVIDSL
jgi:hypothetical protein